MRININVFFIILLICSVTYAQIEVNPQKSLESVEINIDYVNVSSNKPGMSRLNIYVEIKYDDLQFIKENELYFANYEIAIKLLDRDGDQIDGETWQERVIVDTYDRTNSQDERSFSNGSFHVEPGEYKVVFGLTDSNTKRTIIKNTEIELKDFSDKPISLSDITFTNNIEIDSLGVKTICPVIASSVRAKGEDLFAYFEIYTDKIEAKPLKYSYKIISSDRKVVDKNSNELVLDAKRTLEYFRLDKNKLGHGVYIVKIEAKYGSQKDVTTKKLFIRWTGMPSQITDIKLATDQLKYIATKKQISNIKKAPKSERLNRFEEFWKKKDPTPGTERNELMDIYYSRIQYSNENFSGFRDGWKSDMGMIYIIFGPPNDIERHPFERSGKPYEIWYYYTYNRYFVFYDETGFGEYILANPDWRNFPRDGIYY